MLRSCSLSSRISFSSSVALPHIKLFRAQCRSFPLLSPLTDDTTYKTSSANDVYSEYPSLTGRRKYYQQNNPCKNKRLVPECFVASLVISLTNVFFRSFFSSSGWHSIQRGSREKESPLCLVTQKVTVLPQQNLHTKPDRMHLSSSSEDNIRLSLSSFKCSFFPSFTNTLSLLVSVCESN